MKYRDVLFLSSSSNELGWTVKSKKIKQNIPIFFWWKHWQKFSVHTKIHHEITFVEVVAKKIDASKVFFSETFWSADFGGFFMTFTNVIPWWNFECTQTSVEVCHKKKYFFKRLKKMDFRVHERAFELAAKIGLSLNFFPFILVLFVLWVMVWKSCRSVDKDLRLTKLSMKFIALEVVDILICFFLVVVDFFQASI